jgi:hypothetical protein
MNVHVKVPLNKTPENICAMSILALNLRSFSL